MVVCRSKNAAIHPGMQTANRAEKRRNCETNLHGTSEKQRLLAQRTAPVGSRGRSPRWAQSARTSEARNVSPKNGWAGAWSVLELSGTRFGYEKEVTPRLSKSKLGRLQTDVEKHVAHKTAALRRSGTESSRINLQEPKPSGSSLHINHGKAPSDKSGLG